MPNKPDTDFLIELKEQLLEFLQKPLGVDIKEKMKLIPTRLNEYGYDYFGFNPEYAKWAAIIMAYVYKYYFRVEMHGVENLPKGRVLLISNHSGQIPIDATMIATGALLEPEIPRVLRSMVERWAVTLPFVYTFFTRCGQVVGDPDNARYLLNDDEALLVFPEGTKGINKLWYQRYQLQRFGLGFMRLALETNTPIVPVAVIGAEEQAPSLYNATFLAKLTSSPAFPITPTWPLLGPIGMLPYPVKYRIYFGQPLQFSGDPNDEDIVIEKKVREVRKAIKSMITYGIKDRKHIFY